MKTFIFYLVGGSVKKVTGHTEGEAWSTLGYNEKHTPLLRFYHMAGSPNYVTNLKSIRS